MLSVVSLSHPGAVRANNEDYVLWDPAIGLLAIADGMGGHNAGEVASRLAIETLQAYLRETADARHIAWVFGFDPVVSLTANRLVTGFKLANRDVFQMAAERPECQGMGTTLTAAIVEGPRLTFTSVGDSRLYERRDGTLRLLTRDDSLLEKLAETADLELSEAEQHPMRHLLTSVIGARPEVDATVDEIVLADQQQLLLCTDGLHGAIPEDTIRSVLEGTSELERAAESLVHTALERDGKDNITALLARYTAD